MTTLPPPSPGSPLSDRELQVLAGIADGQSYGRIAVELGLAADTVATHAQRLRAKLGARDNAHAVGVACRVGILNGAVGGGRWAA